MRHLVAESLPIFRHMSRGGQGRHPGLFIVGRLQLLAHQRRNPFRQFVEVLLRDPFNYDMLPPICVELLALRVQCPGHPTP